MNLNIRTEVDLDNNFDCMENTRNLYLDYSLNNADHSLYKLDYGLDDYSLNCVH